MRGAPNGIGPSAALSIRSAGRLRIMVNVIAFVEGQGARRGTASDHQAALIIA
jgi:hypothetical protein